MEYMSKTEDVVWLAYKLKAEMQLNVSINMFGLYNEVLTGKYYPEVNKPFNYIDFNIKYSKGEFLRLNVGEIVSYKKYLEKLDAIKALRDVISKIIGEQPVVFYNVDENPYYDWAFTQKREYVQEFIDGIAFDDAIPTGVIVFEENIKDKVKTL